MTTVGYDTAVIGGTMALNSFIRDFKMDGMAKTVRDTTQGNIVSTFQVRFETYNSKHMYADSSRLAASSVRFSLFPLPKNLVERRP